MIFTEGENMVISINDASEIPIYQQIRNQIVLGISDGRLAPGEQLPTVRALAEEIGINSMTVSKAYTLLKQEGYIYTDGNNGSVVRLTPQLQEAIDEELTRGLVQRFVDEAKQNQLSYKKVIALVSELWGDE